MEKRTTPTFLAPVATSLANICLEPAAMTPLRALKSIFANEISSGASNVGVVIFSTQDSANTFNVLNASGGSRSVYPVMSDDINGSS